MLQHKASPDTKVFSSSIFLSETSQWPALILSEHHRPCSLEKLSQIKTFSLENINNLENAQDMKFFLAYKKRFDYNEMKGLWYILAVSIIKRIGVKTNEEMQI